MAVWFYVPCFLSLLCDAGLFGFTTWKLVYKNNTIINIPGMKAFIEDHQREIIADQRMEE